MLKNLKEKFKKGFSKKEIISIAIFAVAVIATIIAIVVNQSNEQSSRRKKIVAGGELARAMTYDQFVDGDEAVDGTDNVKFSAFFLRDVDSDGYAEKIKGTCKQIGKEDTLYMELNVQTDGILKNAKIEIDGKNFYLATTAPKDNELKDNYIGTNIKTLEFNDMANGTQKLITGIVRSGDYSYSSSKANAIGSNINNLSRNDNKIIFTGTYVGSDGNEVEIKKEIVLQTDWYGTTSASISTSTSTYYDIENRQNEEDGTLTLEAGISAYENNDQLNIKKNYVEGTIPQLNGFDPISVTMESSTDSFSYDETTRKFVLTREGTNDSNGNIDKFISDNNNYKLKIIYPLEAYKSLGTSSVTIEVPVMTYYEGYNNPNTEFTNPYKSNEAKGTLIYTFRGPQEKSTSLDISVGEYMYSPTYRYVVSKKKPLKIYNEISSEEKDDNYIVKWYISKGTNETTDGLIMKERKTGENIVADSFVKADSMTDSMENITTNIGIGFDNADKFLAEDGFIKVYDDETDELLVTFTKDDWGKYTKTSPYKFNMPVKHIRVETSETQAAQYFYVYSQKQLDDEYITTNYTREQFDNLKYIKSNLNVYAGEKLLGTVTHSANYEAPFSIASLSVSNNTLSTQLTEKNEILTIKAIANENANQVGWTNGSFLIKLPTDIITADINNVEINNSNISLTSYEYIENDNGRFIKVNTQNTSSTAQTFEIKLDTNITPDPRIATTTEDFELWASNEEGADYYYGSADIYDVNDNLNIAEMVHKSTATISLIAPNSLLTNQTASGFDQKGTQVVSPQIADVKPQLATVSQDTPEKTVRIGAQIKNNYSSVITDVVMLGKIPFEGNTYVLSGEDLGSEFTTKMTDAGIEVPEALKDKVVVYYSENETPDKDLSNAENGWKTAENITNWDNVKTFLIDFKDTEVASGAEYTFYYTIKVPNGLDYNKKSFSHHGVYFALKTDEGKYKTQTEPNKLGLRIAEKYNLELQKYQTGKTNLVPGATYKITKEATDTEDEESKTAVTNAEGKLELQNLYAKRTYTIEEIKTPEDYELNTDVIKIIGTIQEDGSLQVEKTQGTTREDIEITKDGEDQPYKVTIKVEDEAKAKLKITKIEKDTETPLRGIRYKLTGEGLPESGKNISTNANGEITVKGLKIGEEYTLEETKATGYYLASPVKFTVTNTEGTYEISVSEGTVKEGTVTEEENLPIANIQIENEKIPTYNLEISKIQRITSTALTEDELKAKAEQALSSTDTVYLAGAKFKLYKDSKEIGTYITDENGKITLNNLYQYIDGKDEEATYTLKETLSPEGYSKVKDITFKVDGTSGELKFINTEGKNESYTVENNTVKLLVEDSPSFKLIKKDAETSELLANIKFAIYDVEDGIAPAKNSKGEIIGTKETINGKEYYTVTTDENGEITADLPEGMYKAVEVNAPDKYDLSDSTYYFGIGASREGKTGIEATWAQSINSTEAYINCTKATSDGGYIIGGRFENTTNLENGTTFKSRGQDDAILIKYNNESQIEWAKQIGSGNNDNIKNIEESLDGGYVITGSFGIGDIGLNNDVKLQNIYSDTIIKLSSDGIAEWEKNIISTGILRINSMDVTDDGGYILGGYFDSSNIDLGGGITLTNKGSYDGIIIKYNAEGEAEWAKSIGDTQTDQICTIKTTNDGGYIVGGYSNSKEINLEKDIILKNEGTNYVGFTIKYDESGNVEWENAIGGNGTNKVNSIACTSDGKYIVGGYFTSEEIDLGNNIILTKNGTTAGMVIKYNEKGKCEWAKNVSGDGKDIIHTVKITNDGGYLVGGEFSSRSIELDDNVIRNLSHSSSKDPNGLLIKYKENGDIELVQVVGGYSESCINTIDQLVNGKYIVGGYFEGDDIDLEENVKLNISDFTAYNGMVIIFEEKEIVNSKILKANGIICKNFSRINSTVATKDSGYIVGGYFQGTVDLGDGIYLNNNKPNDSSDEGMLIKYSNEGKIEWAKAIGYTGDDSIVALAETKDGGYIVGGQFEADRVDLGNGIILNHSAQSSSSYRQEGMIIKYNSKGEAEWARVIGGNSDDNIRAVVPTSDGGYIVGGNSYSASIELENGISMINESGKSDGFVIKYNHQGEVEWARKIEGVDGAELIWTVCETEDGDYIAGGEFSSSNINLGNNVVLQKRTDNNYYYAMIIKYNHEGEAQWAKSLQERFCYIKESISTNDNGCIVIDNGSNSTPRIIKYSSNGEEEWKKDFGDYGGNNISSIAKTKDNGFVICGKYSEGLINLGNGIKLTRPLGSSLDVGIVAKYNEQGEIEWARQLPSSNSSSNISSVAEDNEGNFILGMDFYGKIEMGNGQVFDSGSTGGRGAGLVCKLNVQNGIPEIQELEVKNKRKEFKITTDVNEIDNIKGGSVSGEDEYPYETVKYGDSSTQEIKMVPDENYEIIGITVNGEDYQFTVNEDGSYTMPAFTNMTEDKHIVVTYSLKDNKITINKVDKNTKEKIPGATFKLDQIEERSNPNNNEIIGELTDNGQEYTVANIGDEVTGNLGELTNNGTYYFVQNDDGTYTPTNSKTYQTANGGTAGIQSSVANSYIPIDLTDLTGQYAVVVNASCESENADKGYVEITESTTAVANNQTGKVVYISGTQNAKDYTSAILEGGKTYYLHMGYYKDGSVDTGSDQIVINSIKLYSATLVTNVYNFTNNDGKYESTNQGVDNTTANSYIPIDLTNYTGKYNLTVNAEISSENGNDIGFATITENTTRQKYNDFTGQFIFIYGTQSAKDYTTVLQGGKMYYLHLGYYKNASASSGDDKFTVNSVSITLNDSELYHTTVETNSEGQAITQIPFGKYSITEIKAPDGYWLNETPTIVEFRSTEDSVHEFTIEDEAKAKLTVHHYIKGTTTKLAEDEYYESKEGESYTTVPKVDLDKYELEIDENGKLVLPENATGTYSQTPTEVTYYYVEKKIPLTVHHYIEGTSKQVSLKDGSLAEDQKDSGLEGESYTTSPILDEELSDEYELVEIPSNSNGVYASDEIIVTYYYKKVARNVQIQKVGEDGVTPLEGTKFKLLKEGTTEYSEMTSNGQDYEFTNYEEMQELEKNLVANGNVYENITLKDEITDVNLLANLTNDGDYYFVEQDGKYIPTNGKTYQVANGGTDGQHNVIANSYIPIDLTNMTGEYVVVVNARVSSENNYDYGYAIINESLSTPSYGTSTGRFMNIAGTKSDADYTAKLEGGKIYYLHLAYRKDSSGSTGEDQVVINSVKLYNADVEKNSYNFEENNGVYIPNNLSTENTVANSYIPVDLRNKTGRYAIVVNAQSQISSSSGYLYATLNTSTTAPSHNTSSGRFVYLGTTSEAKDYVTYVNGGSLYYLHLGYYSITDKNNTAQINSVSLYRTKYLNFAMNKVGDSFESNNTGMSSTISDSYVEIDLSDVDSAKLTVNAAISSQSGCDYGYAIVTESTDRPTYNSATGRVLYISGEQFAKDYEITLTGRKIYYLHMGYRKDASVDSGLDKFIVNSIKVGEYVTNNELITDENGKINITVPYGKYKLVETEALPEYELLGDITEISITKEYDESNVIKLTNVKKTGTVTVHHYIEGTTTPVPLADGSVAQDETKTGKVGDMYATVARADISEGYELLEEPENASGNYIDGNIEVIYYYKAIPASVVVHHYLEGTTTKLADDVTFEGIVGANYTTGVGNVDNKYEVVAIPANANGKMTRETIEVIYYYRLKNTSVLVHHYKEGTSESLSDDVIINGKVDDEYTTTVATDIPSKYELVSEPDNKNGIMTVEQTVVTYYYRLKETGVDVHYYKEGTTEKVSEDVEITGRVDDKYTTTPATDIESKYELVETPANAIGTMTEDRITVIYYYRLKDTSVLVHHYLEGTTTKLADDEIINGQVDDIYKTVESTDLLFGKYDLVAEPENKTGTMTEDQIVVIYYYRLKNTSVLVHHYIKDTTTSLSDDVTINGQIDDEYTTTIASDIPEYYELVAEPDNKEGIMTKEQIVVTYYYQLKNYPYVVNYLEKGTDNVLHETKQGDELVYGSTVNSVDEKIDIDGYKFDSFDKDILTIGTANNVINIYYTKRNDLSYKVNYLEKGTNNVIHEQKVQDGMTFESVVTSADEVIDIDGYNYDSVDKDTLKITTSENVINIYYTKRTDLSYKVNYLEKDTNKVLNAQKIQGGMTFGTVITSNDEVIEIDGYNYDSVDKNSIAIGTSENVINIYYTKRTDLSYKVNYLEKDTNKVLHDQKVQDGMTFESVVTSANEVIDINGYDYDSVDKETLIITTSENVINIYYTKRTDLSYKVNYLEKDTNKVLHEQKVQDGMTFESTVTSADEVIDIDGYNYDSVDKDSLTITTGENVINIYYTKRTDLSYKVNYLEKTTNKVLHEQKTQDGMTFESVVTSSDEVIEIDGYNYDSVDKDTLTITTGENVINIYYTKRTDLSYKVNYLEKDTNKVLHNQKTQGGMTFEAEVKSADEVIDINGYKYDSADKESIKITTGENVINIYYTKIDGLSYTVNYLEKDTNEVINPAKTVDGMTFEDVITSSDEIIDIDGYNYDSVDKDTLTIGTEENIINIYYTKRTDLSYKVNYLEKDTNKILNAQKTQNGMIFNAEVKSADEVIAIDGYDYDSVDKETLIITTEENVINIYYTKRNDLSYKVNYLEKDTNKVLHDQKVQDGMTFESTVNSSDEVIDIDGYNYDSVDKDSLTITTGENVINVYYTKRTDLSYKVNYLEKTTNKVLHDQKVQEGMTFESVVTSANEVIDIDGYNYDSVDKDSLTITTGENVINIYYTKRTDLSYTVNYLEKDTNIVLHEPKVADNMTFESIVTSANEVIDIDGYNYDSVDKETLTITTGTNVINIYYTKRNDLSYTVNYLEKDTNKVLNSPKVADNMTFGTVITSKDEVIKINGYNYDSVDKETLTITTGANVINVYYTKVTGLSYTVNYLEKDTDEVIHPAKTTGEQVFETEITSADEVIDIDGFNYDSVDKDTLVIGTGENVINIYYTKRDDLSYTVNYLEKDTDKVLHAQKNQTGVTFKDTIASADEVIDIDGYDYDSVDKETLTITTGENVINIYYTKRTDLSYKVNYLEKTTNKVLHEQKVQDGMTFESTVTSANEVIAIDGYDYDSVDKDSLTITTGENVINIYYTKRTDLSYKVNYLEKTTNKVLHEQKIQEGMTFESTITSSDEVIDIDGYNYDSVDKDTLTITTGENVINVYYTKRTDLSYKVNYLEKTTNKVLHEQKVQDNMTFEDVVTSSDEVIEIDGYNYDSVDKDTLTITTGENVINIYYTKRTDLSYKVNYLEKDTNKVLHNQKTQGGMIFETEVKSADEVIDINGYKYDSADKESIKITTGENVINIYYTKIDGLSYTVNYLEKDTNEVINPAKTVDGMTFEDVITSSDEVIDIDGYNYDSVDKDTLTIGTEENVINIYYTKRTDLSYKVNYLEKDTNKILNTQKTQNGMTFESVVNSSDEVIDINGYNYDSVDKETLIITTGENVINIYYTKRTDLSYKVNYLEKDTNKVLHDQKVQDGMTFEDVVTSSDEVIDIDGYDYDSVDKETLTITTGENVINVYYTKRTDLSYKVNYLEKTTNKILHDQKVQDGMTFESVVTSANEVIDIDGYNYDSVDKETLTITTSENVINIYYTKRNDLSYTVNYLEKDTNIVLHEPKVTENMTFESIVTSANEVIDIDGYNYDSVDKETLTITTGTNVINVYYTKRNDLSYTVNYLEKDTNKVLNAPKVTDNMIFGATITSKDEVIKINGYNYDSVDKDSLTISTGENVINVYYTKVTGLSYTVNYLDKGTDEVIHPAKTTGEQVFETEITSADEVIDIDGYNYDSVDKDKLIIGTGENVINIYYTKRDDLSYTVNYLEKDTDKVLHAQKNQTGMTFKDTVVSADEVIDIDGYDYDSVDKEILTITTNENVINIYYTKRTDLSYKVNYLEKDTNKVLHDQKVQEGMTFESTVTSANEVIAIDGYDYDSVDKDSLTITTGENVINIYYTKRTDLSYKVNYLEKTTNKVLHDQKVQDGMTFESTVTSANEVIDIDGYDYDSVDRDSLTITTGENVINIYYTKRTDLSYKVNYLEKTTNKVLHEQKVQDNMTFEDVVTSSDEIIDIDGYNYDSVDKDTLTITTGENVINIYYTKRNDLSYTVNYLEKDTNKVLHNQKTQGGMTFEAEVKSADEVIDINGYKYDSADKESIKITTGENVINIYYTKIDGLSYTVNYLDKETNEVINPAKTKDGMTFEDVVTSRDEIISIDGYNFDSVDKETLTIGTEENIINIYYTKRTDLSYKVNYLEKDTNKVLHDQKVQDSMIFESVVTSVNEVIAIDGYNYDSVDKETLTITTGENVINVYYTKRIDLSYTVNYLEKDTNIVLHEPKVTDNMTFEDIVNSSDEVIDIDGYNYDSVDKDSLTITTSENVINIYYTKRNDLSYKVNYLEKDTNRVLHNQKVQDGMTYKSVVNSSNEVIDIDGYNYDSVDKDSLTITTGENVINVYYIKRTDLSYTVNYLEKDTNIVLHEPKVTENMTFESVVTSANEVIDIDGYNYDSVDKDSLTITTSENVINIYYTKRNDLSYTVNYLEKGTNRTIYAPKVTQNMIFGTEITSSKEVIAINGYSYDSVDKDSLIITTGENVINIYYTKVSGLSYTVNYLEKDTDKVLQAPKTTGDMTFEDEITSSDEVIEIDGYNYDSVDKDKLVIGTGENVINIYYTKRNDLSYKVNYLEKDTNKVLHNQKVQDNMTFEDVVTSSDEVIDIDGYNYDSVDKDTLTITTSENVINIYYTKRNDLSYTVNYLEKDTNKVLHESKTTENMMFESVVNSSDEIINIYGYNYDSVDKDTLTITTGENVINIYYTKKDTKVTVHYYEEGTTNRVSEDVEITGKVFDDYTTASADDIPSKYELVAEPENKNGTMTEDEITVIYYYRKKATQVIVHYYEENTTTKLSEDVTIDGRVDDPYSTVSATDVPIKYELVAEPVNKAGSMTEATIEVIYYYRVKDAVVNVRYLEKGTNIELADADKIDGKVDDLYETSAKNIEGYQLVEHTGNEKGKFEVEPITITYYYLYKTKATVQYIDKITGQILEQSTTEGLEGDEFVTESKDFENYVLVEEPAEKTVKMTKEEQILKYYYIHVSGGVVEKHIDVISGQILANAVHEGNEGDEYDIPSRTFDGYDLVEDRLPANSKGTMKVDPVEVTYYYIYKSKVTAEYIDKNTGNRLTDDVVQNGHEGDNYTTERKTFDDYKLVEVPANADGSMTKEDIKVTYYYVHTSGGVIVNHIDIKTGKQLLDETKEEGYEGDPYETHEENISGYDLVKDKYPENATGKMTIDPTRVTYYYIKKTEVNVKYVDSETGEEIDVPTNIPGHEGDDYKTEPKDVPGYDLVDEPANKNGTMTADPIDVIYYYRRPAKVIVNYYDADTKEKLVDEIEITGHQNDEYTTEQKDIKYYEIKEVPENKDGKMTVTVTKDENGNEIVEDTTYVNYYYRKLIFNLRVDKTIASVIVNGQETAINGNLGKVEVHRKELSTANVKVVYKIKVTNDSELTGKANVVENIPSGMTMKSENNPGWTINETTASIETDEIKPGESREYQVVLGWQNGDSNIGTKENVASIVTENEAGFNEKDTSDNESRADLIVAVGTGEVPYVAIAGGVLMIMIAMTAGIYIITKKRQ